MDEVNDGAVLLQERKVSNDWGRMDLRWIILKGSKRIEYAVSNRLYSSAELSNLLKDCGFRKVDVYGNLEGVPYDHKARRLVVVASK